MKYSEIYTPDFLKLMAKKVGKSESEFIELLDSEVIDDSNGKINIEYIAEKLNIDIDYQDMPNDSGSLQDNKITIDKNETTERQRFTIGHEIGHFMLGDTEAARKDSTLGYTRKEMEHEKVANAVSAELLMPRQLVVNNVSQVITSHELNKTSLSSDQVASILSKVAEIMQVSVQALTYRVKNLQLFTD